MKNVKMTKVSDLRKHPSYAHIYAAKSPQFDLLVSSIEGTGELLEPIVITLDNVILSGVQRWLAYQELGRELIPAIIYDGPDSLDQLSLIISFNQYRTKSTREKWNEIKHLKLEFGKKQGQRTDLMSEKDVTNVLSTRAFIAKQLGISEGNVYKIEKVADGDPILFSLIDTKEISLHEAYNRVTEKLKPASSNSDDSNGKTTDDSIECCPNCKRAY
jgi:hypothetical protein